MKRPVRAENPCISYKHKYEESIIGSGSPFYVLFRCSKCSDEVFNYDPDQCDCPNGPIMVNPSDGRCCSCDKKVDDY